MVLLPRSLPRDTVAGFVAVDPLPMTLGDTGDAVLDLQERLRSLDLPAQGDRAGYYGDATCNAVREFQRARGLHVDGVCNRDTWEAVVEAGYQLGVRLLYKRAPTLRGDDVAELQRQLSAVGFYTGTINAIFDDRTKLAVDEFQRNVGLPVDGMVGPHTTDELRRLRSHITEGHLVSALRERLLRGTIPMLRGTKVAVGELGGFAQGVAAVCRALSSAGAVALDLHHPESTMLAAEANSAGAAVYIGLQLDPASHACRTAYYSGYRYESVASKRLAELVHSDLCKSLGLADGGVLGMAIPILRETRMPAILVELGDPAAVVLRTSDIGEVLVRALTDWLSVTWD
jgi:N-acetylmuramoyl-L-alanine amidase